LPEILAAAGIDDPVLVGHSDGASIAIIHAAAAGRTRALVLEAPHVFTEEMGLRSIAKAREAYEHGDLRPAPGEIPSGTSTPPSGVGTVPGSIRSSATGTWRSFLPRIAAPVLIVQGEQDEYGSGKQIDAIRRGARSVEVLLLPRCGHSPHRDQPEAALQGNRGLRSQAPPG